jgi:glycosyltransferase involved in cell wall biosynthesis
MIAGGSMGEPRRARGPRFLFVSTCTEPWGGSEELWSQAAESLATQNHAVDVVRTVLDRHLPGVRRLEKAGCSVHHLHSRPIVDRLLNPWLPSRIQITPFRQQAIAFGYRLRRRRPHLVVVAQGDNYDGLFIGRICHALGVPYVVISQKATDQLWPRDDARHLMRQAFLNARACYFVSHHNRRITEEQLDVTLRHAEIVANPFLVDRHAPIAWPSTSDGWRLACVARVQLSDKGQDLLIRVLSRPSWRARDLSVTFFGTGINLQGLKDLASRLGVTRVTFAGHVDDIQAIWRDHHAIVLPSRAEGLPLALVEAMLCGRPAVVTAVGGNAELVDEGVTGFLAAGPEEGAIDAALERAWHRRDDWRQMGNVAARHVRAHVPEAPGREFAERLLSLVSAA